MRIVVWGINYSPELTGIGPCNTALCESLAGKGHEVEMLTTFAYYPAWCKGEGDEGKLYRTDVINEVTVRRCWHFVPEIVTTKRRIWHELSFVLCSTLRFLSLRRPDVFVVVSPPLLLGLAAWLVGMIKGSPFIFHVQDLQPDAAVGLGMLKPGLMTRFLYWLENLAYRKAWKVSGISHGMLRAFGEKSVEADKTVYFPNAIALHDEEGNAGTPNRPVRLPQMFRDLYGFAEDDFLAVYSGNLGAKQGLATLIDAAPLVCDPRVKIIICGDGARRDELIAQARGKQIFFLPLLAEPEYRQMMAEANVCVITQAAGTGRVFFPSKLLSALSLSKPVLTVADKESELARAVEQAGCGVNLLPDLPADVAACLDQLASQPDELLQMGRRGRHYVSQFETCKVLGEFESVLRSALVPSAG